MRRFPLVATALCLVSLALPAIAQEDTPAAPDVTGDPMLLPVPPALKEVATWGDVRQILVARSTTLLVAVQEVKRAEALTRSAIAGVLPSLNANGTATLNFITRDQNIGGQISTTPPPSLVSGSITASIPVIAPRAWIGIRTGGINEDVANMSLEDVKRTIALSVATSIVGVVTTERIAELNRSGLRTALERLELTKRKAALGAGTGLDIARAQQDVEAARAAIVSGDESLRQARESLGIALGMPLGVGVPPTITLDQIATGTLNACKPTASLDERPDIVAARFRIDSAHQAVQDAKAQFSPTVTVSSTAATNTATTFATPNTSTWNLVAVLTVPIWDGGNRYGILRSANALEEEARQNLIALRNTAEIQVIQARRGVEVAEAARVVATSARDAAKEVDRLVRTAYAVGQGTSLELVTAASSLRQAEITLALREFDLVRAKVLAVLTMATCPY